MEASDRTLMLRYQRGDREAFAELVRRYQTPLYNYVLRQLGSALVAEDVTRQVFLSVVRESAAFKEDDSFPTWLYSLALGACRRERARSLSGSSPRVVVPESWAQAAPSSSPLGPRRPSAQASDDAEEPSGERAAPAEPIEDSVVRAVDTLPEQEKDVYLLREIAGLGFAQIAAVTELGESVVRLRLFQAFERLRTTLQDFEEYRRALR